MNIHMYPDFAWIEIDVDKNPAYAWRIKNGLEREEEALVVYKEDEFSCVKYIPVKGETKTIGVFKCPICAYLFCKSLIESNHELETNPHHN